ncbi:MAG: tRNA (adenosine(37)-N6)-threonylcarbamoyltransferase complex ATPase subunit type 1 TsaE, partial [Deltaproteobacteria bacterium]|nr:tRNA (adenosine(37)-N6)-threonylcarbamoyltransferase complex ATPase subunit type 1 TsaE [Deltaproteobacteria bacterium]
KTTLCQGLAEALGASPGEAVSPTFTLCNVYRAQRPIFHLDLYRLDPGRAAEEFVGAGLEECLDGLCLVEWPERLARRFWPDERLELIIEPRGTGRILSARGTSPAAARIWRAATIAASDDGQE